MFQSDKLLKQSLIILSQLGTVFLCRHELVFPAVSAPNKLSNTRGKNPNQPLCLHLTLTVKCNPTVPYSSQGLPPDSRAIRGSTGSLSFSGGFFAWLPSSAFYFHSYGAWHPDRTLVMWPFCHISPNISPYFTFLVSYLVLNLKSEGNGKNTKHQVSIGRSGGSEIYLLGLPWRFSGWDSTLLVQGAGVQSLVRELGSPVWRSMAKNK